MRCQPTAPARAAASLFAVLGLVAFVMDALPHGGGDVGYGVLGLTLIGLAALVWVVPWGRWDDRATLVLAVPASALIGVANATGLTPSRAQSTLFVVGFVWLGTYHKRWASLWVAPVAVVAYVVSVVVHTRGVPLDARAVVMFGAVCILVAETIAFRAQKARESEGALRATQVDLQVLADNTTDVVTRIAADGVIRYVSPSVVSVLGWRPDELVGRSATVLCHPDDTPIATVFATVAHCERIVTTRRLVRSDGSYVWMESASRLVTGSDATQEILSSARDISERHEQLEALARSEAKYRKAFEDAPVAMAHIGHDGRYVKVNAALGELTGYRPEELIGSLVTDFAPSEDVGDIARDLNAGATGVVTGWRGERRILRRDGTVAWVAVAGTVVRGAGDTVDYLLAHYSDITTLKDLEERLRHLADHDPLTDLLNRRGFELALDRQVAFSQRYEGLGALLLLDLDGFKDINDTFGHRAGDTVIIAVADVLRQRQRGSDIVARIGGDEFAVMLPRANAVQARTVADSIGQAIRTEQIRLPLGGHVAATASIGIAVYDDTVNSGELLHRADLALYEAKHAGKNRSSLFTTNRSDTEDHGNPLCAPTSERAGTATPL